MTNINYTYAHYDMVCRVVRSHRKTMTIAVTPQMEILLRVPMHSTEDDIQKIVNKRKSWIYEKLQYFQSFRPLTPPRKYISGETHLYLGRQYRLKIRHETPFDTHIKDGYIWIYANTPEQAQKKLNNWYRTHAKQKFAERLQVCLSQVPNATMPKLHIRKMKTHWGSLSPSGIMTLNTDLIRASVDCIDYIIIHELCHQRYMNHSRDFWQYLDTIHPNWQKIKHKLETSLS